MIFKSRRRIVSAMASCVERLGDRGTFAEDRPETSGTKLVVTLTYRGSCWTTGNFSLTDGDGPGSRRLPNSPKISGSEGGLSDATCMQKRAAPPPRGRLEPATWSLPEGLKTLDSKGEADDTNLMQKRANLARVQHRSRKASLMILPLALSAWAIGATCELGADCSGEAKVSIERNGPNGTFAED